ncbi:hypothetical protein G7074_15820 [Pedobacter sp. HDW13]|uniref:hypothetical protein n=1 Tax=Pedobacter sp. HDW13 TaxID=2714940 RepID=UPI00140ABA72|nr:hypothetical protein [Pedobacter sp. HDW13]QIL40604.1 hypothetical protein G7074_15820 [Pedobacter sp. HDW13]
MKRILIFAMLLVSLTTMAQTPPPLKVRSDAAFTQADTYLAALKGLQIPSGATNTLIGSGTRVNLFYNTVDKILYIHNGVDWRPAIEADLTQFYTKAETDLLLNKYILANVKQTANINLKGSVTSSNNDESLNTTISGGTVAFYGSAGGGQINLDGYNTSTPSGSIQITPVAVNISTDNNNSLEMTPSYIRMKSGGYENSIVRGLEPANVTNRLPSKDGTFATLEDLPDVSAYAKLYGGNAFSGAQDIDGLLKVKNINVSGKVTIPNGSITSLKSSADTIAFNGAKSNYIIRSVTTGSGPSATNNLIVQTSSAANPSVYSTVLTIDNGGITAPLVRISGGGGAPNGANAVSAAYLNSIYASGTYTPVLSARLNTASATAGTFHYTKVGNEITIYGNVTFMPFTANEDSAFKISLPMAYQSTFTTPEDLAGHGSLRLQGPVFIEGTVSDGTADVSTRPTLTTPSSCYISFTYTLK